MLSHNDINKMFEDNFKRQLQENISLPNDLARGYKDWVHGLVDEARQKIKMETQSAQQMQQAAAQ